MTLNAAYLEDTGMERDCSICPQYMRMGRHCLAFDSPVRAEIRLAECEKDHPECFPPIEEDVS
jgi:hypothetical protein